MSFINIVILVFNEPEPAWLTGTQDHTVIIIFEQFKFNVQNNPFY